MRWREGGWRLGVGNFVVGARLDFFSFSREGL
jgi:hypothetical protein